MNTWIVWTFNPGGYPKVQSREVVASDLYSLTSVLPGHGIDANTIFAINLKGTAPMAPGMPS